MNRLQEHRPTRAELVPFDPVRHALEARIESAKERLFADLDTAQRQLRAVASTAARGVARSVTRAALVGGLLALGLVAALVLRRQRKHLRIVWK